MTTNRLKKKFHKFWLQEVLIDVSQSTYWRRILFSSDYNEVFAIDRDHVEGMNDETVKAIRRYKLRYLVTKVPPEITDAWLSEAPFQVVFKFWCADYPALRGYSGNNPRTV